MSFQKVILTTILILICTIMFTFLSGCSSQEMDLNKKAVDEIEYLSTKFIDMLNRLNNITFENYKITTEQISLDKETAEQEKSSSSSSSQSTENSDNEEENNNSNEEDSTSIIASQMSPNTILNPVTTQIDWAGIKNEIENIYYAWNTILLDLYELNINKDDIIKFSEDLDQTTQNIKNEDKLNSTHALANLYSYLPKYIQIISQDTSKINLYKTKSFIINAYALIENGKWNMAKDEINKAGEAFSVVMADASFIGTNSYQINKSYVMLNELKNSVSLEDREIFYIKYRNLLEEIDNL